MEMEKSRVELESIFPMLRRLIGPQEFQRLSQNFNSQNRGSLSHFSVAVWSDSVSRLFPFAPELVDLEWRIARKLHENTSGSAKKSKLAELKKPELKLKLRNDFEATIYRHSVASIWVSLQQGHGQPALWNLPEGAALFKSIYHEAPTVRAYDPAEIEFLMNLQNGETVLKSCAEAQTQGVNVDHLLQMLIDELLILEVYK